MKKINFEFLKGNSNTQQAVWVGVSSFSSFIVGILSSVILSRYFEKSDYGTYKQIVFIFNTFLMLFAAGLPSAYAYFLPKLTKSEGKGVLNRLTQLFILFGILYALTLYFASGIIAEVLKNPELEGGLKLFSLVPLLMMPTMGVEGVYTAIRKTHILAIYTTVTRIGALLFITLPVIILKGTVETAIIGWIFSSLLTCILAIYLKYKPFRGVGKVASISVRKILNYSVPLMIASLSGVFIRSADQFFLSRYFGTEVFAEYSNGFIPLPFIPMIIGAIHAVFVPMFSKMIEQDNGLIQIAESWKSGVNKAIILIFPLLVFFMFFAKEVILILYGPLYEKSYIYFRFAMLINFTMPFLFYSILLAAGKTKIYANLHIVNAIIIWTLGYIVCKFGTSPFHYIILSVILGIVFRYLGLVYAAKVIKARIVNLLDLRFILKILSISLVLGFVAKQAGLYIADENVFILAIGMSVFFGLLLMADRFFQLKILNTVFSVFKKKT